VAGGLAVAVLLLLVLLVPFTATPPEEAIDSIAILPFENRSGDPELEYVSDGITQGVISRLSQLSSLDKVISSSSVRQYKGKEVDARTVAQEVDVRAVVMGNMASQGENLRIYVELVDAENNSTLWSENYTRLRSTVYELEETLSKEIADALGIQLTGEEGERLTKRYTENAEAHEAYLRGRVELDSTTAVGRRRAVRYLEEAIQKDPAYALAHSALAEAYFVMSILNDIPSLQGMPRAEELTMKALEIDNSLAEAHVMLANVRKSYYWDWAGAEREYQLALDLDPSSYNAHDFYGYFMSAMGRHDEAITLSRRALQLDPLNLDARTGLIAQLYYARRYEEAIEQVQKDLEVNPNNPIMFGSLANVYQVSGQYEEAVAARQKEWTLGGASEDDIAYTASGKDGYWRWQLEYGTEQAKQEYVSPIEFAEYHAQLGEKDHAFEWLEKANTERVGLLYFLNVEPLWDPLRDDPRFQDLLRRMNLEP
jgi:serine/threonine-protein kinase